MWLVLLFRVCFSLRTTSTWKIKLYISILNVIANDGENGYYDTLI